MHPWRRNSAIKFLYNTAYTYLKKAVMRRFPSGGGGRGRFFESGRSWADIASQRTFEPYHADMLNLYAHVLLYRYFSALHVRRAAPLAHHIAVTRKVTVIGCESDNVCKYILGPERGGPDPLDPPLVSAPVSAFCFAFLCLAWVSTQ